VIFVGVRKLDLEELSVLHVAVTHELELINGVDGLAIGVLESDEILVILVADDGGGCLRHHVTACQSHGLIDLVILAFIMDIDHENNMIFTTIAVRIGQHANGEDPVFSIRQARLRVNICELDLIHYVTELCGLK